MIASASGPPGSDTLREISVGWVLDQQLDDLHVEGVRNLHQGVESQVFVAVLDAREPLRGDAELCSKGFLIPFAASSGLADPSPDKAPKLSR